jgi:hypothetical protein
MLNEISQMQKYKDHVFALINGRQIQKINIYTKQTRLKTNLYVEHVCNSEIWGSREKKRE